MFGKNPRLNALASRKQLLLAESELNRFQIVGDIAAVKAVVLQLTDRAKSFGSIAALTEVVVAGLVGFQRGRYAEVEPKRSWLKTVLKGAGLVSSIWLAFRARRRNYEGPPSNSRA